jgi:hypothetical protein
VKKKVDSACGEGATAAIAGSNLAASSDSRMIFTFKRVRARAPHAFCCRCCFLFSPSRREVSPSFLGDRRGNSSRRDSGGGVRVSCRDSGVDGGRDGGSNGGRGGVGDRGGFGGSPGPVQGGVGPALVELGAPSRAHAAHGDVRGGGAAAPRGAAVRCRRAQAREHDVATVRGGMVRGEGERKRKGEWEKNRRRRRPPPKRTPALSLSLNFSSPPTFFQLTKCGQRRRCTVRGGP